MDGSGLARQCLTCRAPLPNDLRQKRCPETCAVEWRKGWPKRVGYKAQYASIKRLHGKHQTAHKRIARARRRAARAKRLRDFQMLGKIMAIPRARDITMMTDKEHDRAAPYMRSLKFGYTSAMQVFACGRWWKIEGKRGALPA